jgi:ADP-heptose:LPS heptosyltransferase
LRIGVVWSGNPLFHNDQHRSMRLSDLLPLLKNEAYRFFLLQKDVRAADLPLLREFLQSAPHVADLDAELADFADTAAIVAKLDLVITVDTSVAHLAGAMGKPVWILLPFAGDFRWLLDRSDSPWYPSARLFRQPMIGDWGSVIAEVTQALSSLPWRVDA